MPCTAPIISMLEPLACWTVPLLVYGPNLEEDADAAQGHAARTGQPNGYHGSVADRP